MASFYSYPKIYFYDFHQFTVQKIFLNLKYVLKRGNFQQLKKYFSNAIEIFRAVKNHLFFASINWTELEKKRLTPPFKPQVGWMVIDYCLIDRFPF